jgi:hypothetical protein
MQNDRDILDRLTEEADDTFAELPVVLTAADVVRIERLLRDAASEITRLRGRPCSGSVDAVPAVSARVPAVPERACAECGGPIESNRRSAMCLDCAMESR